MHRNGAYPERQRKLPQKSQATTNHLIFNELNVAALLRSLRNRLVAPALSITCRAQFTKLSTDFVSNSEVLLQQWLSPKRQSEVELVTASPSVLVH
jgi:hypothetical protein